MSLDIQYVYDRPRVSIVLRFRNRIAGWLDRQSVLNQFLRDNNIDTEDIGKRSVTKIEYIVRTPHVEYLARVRENDLLREASKPQKIRKVLLDSINFVQIKLDHAQIKLTSLLDEYSSVKNKLASKDLTLLQRAHSQGDRGTLEASIKNQKDDVMSLKQTIFEYEEQLKDNSKMFEKYCKELDGAYDVTLNSYIKVAGRKLNSVGFTLYGGAMRDFDKKVYRQAKEMVDGK